MPIDLRKYSESGPFSEVEVDDNWTAIEDAVNQNTSDIADIEDNLPPKAVVLDIRAGLPNKYIDPANMYAAAEPVTLADGATITMNMASAINARITLGGNRTLANPINQKVGQSGVIVVRQDGTGSRTLTYGTNWKFAGGAPVLSTAANAIDTIAYFVESAGVILATFSKGHA